MMPHIKMENSLGIDGIEGFIALVHPLSSPVTHWLHFQNRWRSQTKTAPTLGSKTCFHMVASNCREITCPGDLTPTHTRFALACP